ncbi:hypothetical protein GGX14DRAFT_459177 [Mycena pura]|uniref:Uncharacterized protein n=1 Tax=Mycena pura TaxID=153505 RepID=A0AAD6Y743_9AGAR|nr:hypothetical protein GGX14DRAFT_459177 [Mycena pura]
MAALRNITLAIADDALAVATSQLAITVFVTQDGEMRLDIRAAGAADENSPVGIPIQVVHASAGAGHAGGPPPAAMWPMSSSGAQPPRTDGTAAPSPSLDSDILPTYSLGVAPPPYSLFRSQTTSNQSTAPMSNQPMHNTMTTPAPAVPPPGGTPAAAAPTPIGLGLVHRPQLPTPPPTPPNPVLAPVSAPPMHTHQQMTFPAQRRRPTQPPSPLPPAPLGEILVSALATLGAQLWPLQMKRPRAAIDELGEMPDEDGQENGRRAKRRRL